MLKTIWRFREGLYVLTILALGWYAFVRDTDSVVVVDGPVRVVEKEIAEEVIKVAERADKPKGVVERVTTREVPPDTIIVSRLPTEGEEAPSVVSPRRVPSVPLQLPEWGIQEVRVEGHRVRISSLSRGTGEVQQSVHTVRGNYQPGLTIRAGNVPRSLREDREFRFLRLRFALDAHAGLSPSTGAPRGTAILSGPVSIGGDNLRISPSVAASTTGGLSVGVSARICLLGDC